MGLVKHKIDWLNSYERDREFNVEVGFENRGILRGYVSSYTFERVEDLPRRDYFLELRERKPKKYEGVEMERGELSAMIGDDEYSIIYMYSSGRYLIVDEKRSVVVEESYLCKADGK